MREEHGRILGDAVVYEQFTLWGAVTGSVKVIEGGKFYLRGTVWGDLRVEPGGRVHIFGSVAGKLIIEPTAKVILSGRVGGDAINQGGRLYINPGGEVFGDIKTKKRGKTDFLRRTGG